MPSPRLLVALVSLVVLACCVSVSAQEVVTACEQTCRDARMACSGGCGMMNQKCMQNCIAVKQSCSLQCTSGVAIAPAAFIPPSATPASFNSAPSICSRGCEENKANCVNRCGLGGNPICPQRCVEELRSCKSHCPLSPADQMTKDALASKERDRLSALGGKSAPRESYTSTRVVDELQENYLGPEKSPGCSHAITRSIKGKCVPDDICDQVRGEQLSYRDGNCQGSLKCCVSKKPLPPAVTALPEGMACPISFLEAAEVKLTAAQKRFCREERKKYLAARAAKAGKTAPAAPASAAPKPVAPKAAAGKKVGAKQSKGKAIPRLQVDLSALNKDTGVTTAESRAAAAATRPVPRLQVDFSALNKDAGVTTAASRAAAAAARPVPRLQVDFNALNKDARVTTAASRKAAAAAAAKQGKGKGVPRLQVDKSVFADDRVVARKNAPAKGTKGGKKGKGALQPPKLKYDLSVLNDARVTGGKGNKAPKLPVDFSALNNEQVTAPRAL